MKKSLISLCLFLAACTTNESYLPGNYLSAEAENTLVRALAVYVDTRPDNTTPAERFDSSHTQYYDQLVRNHQSRLLAYFPKNDTIFFLYAKKDIKSMYEHYRYIGGMFTLSSTGKIEWLDQSFYSPRLTLEELEKGHELFAMLVEGKSILPYVGNPAYIEWPDADFVYSPEKQEWVLQDTSRLRSIGPMLKE